MLPGGSWAEAQPKHHLFCQQLFRLSLLPPLHLLLSSACFCGQPRVCARPSGSPGRSRRSAVPASPPEGKAAGRAQSDGSVEGQASGHGPQFPPQESHCLFALPGGAPGAHRFGGFDEHLGPSQLELVGVHVDRLHQVHHALPLVATPARPRLWGQDGVPGQEEEGRWDPLGCCPKSKPSTMDRAIPQRCPEDPARTAGFGGDKKGRQLSPLEEFLENSSICIAGPAHPDVLLQPQIFHLVLHPGKGAKMGGLWCPPFYSFAAVTHGTKSGSLKGALCLN